MIGYFFNFPREKKRWEELSLKYSQKDFKEKKDIQEVITYLKNQVDCIEEINEEDYKLKKELIKFNVSHCPLYKDNNKDFIIKIYEIQKNDKSKKYYDLQNDDEIIYIIFELKTGYFESNSNLLFLELELEKGIDKKDIEEKNEFYQNYISYLDMYEEMKREIK